MQYDIYDKNGNYKSEILFPVFAGCPAAMNLHDLVIKDFKKERKRRIRPAIIIGSSMFVGFVTGIVSTLTDASGAVIGLSFGGPILIGTISAIATSHKTKKIRQRAINNLKLAIDEYNKCP